MFVISNENKLKNLEIGEYFFLTENLEFTNQSQVKNSVQFIIKNKKTNLVKTVQDIIENELNNIEKTVIKLYFYDGLGTNAISKMCNIARSSVYRNLKSGLYKIENSMKYVLRYDEYCSAYSVDELLKEVKGEVH